MRIAVARRSLRRIARARLRSVQALPATPRALQRLSSLALKRKQTKKLRKRCGPASSVAALTIHHSLFTIHCFTRELCQQTTKIETEAGATTAATMTLIADVRRRDVVGAAVFAVVESVAFV